MFAWTQLIIVYTLTIYTKIMRKTKTQQTQCLKFPYTEKYLCYPWTRIHENTCPIIIYKIISLCGVVCEQCGKSFSHNILVTTMMVVFFSGVCFWIEYILHENLKHSSQNNDKIFMQRWLSKIIELKKKWSSRQAI